MESKTEKPLADMERQDFINTITELKAMISSLKLTIDTLRKTINSQNATIASLQKSMDRLQSAYDKAVKERDDLNGRMNRSNQETFGSKSLKQSGRGKVVKNDRQKERDEWSSKDDNDNNASSASSSADGETDQTKVKSENLSRSGRNGMKYNRMNAAKTITFETSNWEALVKYRNDGSITIDNMSAERAVRSFTVKRKNSLFFSSEDGIESALKYHTLIETCKNVGLNVKEYFTYVFSRLIEGEKDYEKLLPSAVAR